jgi:DNA transformation protein
VDKTEEDFLIHIMQDKLGHISNLRSKKMFGGYGIYKNGVFFAIIAESQLYFKTGEANIEDYKSMDSEPFVYERGDHKKVTMSYWLVPEEILEDEEEIEDWVNKAIAVSKAKRR